MVTPLGPNVTWGHAKVGAPRRVAAARAARMCVRMEVTPGGHRPEGQAQTVAFRSVHHENVIAFDGTHPALTKRGGRVQGQRARTKGWMQRSLPGPAQGDCHMQSSLCGCSRH